MDTVLPCAAGTATPPPFLACVREASSSALSEICGCTASEAAGPARFSGTLAVMTLAGAFSWSLVLCVPRETAVGLASCFAGFDIPNETVELGDAVGELLNVVAGRIGTSLDRSGFPTRLALPTVSRGDAIEVLLRRDQREVCLSFVSPHGPLWLRIVTDGGR